MSYDTHAIKLTFKTMIAWFTTLIHTLNWIKTFNFIDNLPYFFTKISNSRRRISLLEFPIIRKRLRKWNWEQNSRPAWHFPSPISLGRRKRVPESRELLMLFCHALLSLKVRAQTQHVGLHDAVENILNFIEWEETPHSRNPHGCNGKLQTNYARSINFPSASVLLYIWDVCTVRAQTVSTHREMTIWSSVQQCDELDLACCVCMWWVSSILSQISYDTWERCSHLTTVTAAVLFMKNSEVSSHQRQIHFTLRMEYWSMSLRNSPNVEETWLWSHWHRLNFCKENEEWELNE